MKAVFRLLVVTALIWLCLPTSESFGLGLRVHDAASQNKRPLITGISPATGSSAGGTVITITGLRFNSAATVLVSGNAATSVHYIDTTQITATIPASIPANTGGNAPITVVNPSGFSEQMSGVFAYVPVFYTSCASVKATGILADGNYTLTLSGHSFTVYCNNMAGTPAEYITPTYTYNSGYGSNNFGLFACGGACSGSDVKTNYNRIRFDPSTMEISLTDKTFSYQPVASNTYSGQGILGLAADCRGINSAAGQAQLDLRGTPFSVDDSVVVSVAANDGVNGYYPGGSVNMDGTRKYYYVTGGGYCGWCGPMNSNGSARYSVKVKFDN